MSWLRPWAGLAAPTYLWVALLLGGSSLAAGRNLVLQLAGIGLLAWAALVPTRASSTRPARLLAILSAGLVLLAVAQLVPLPPGVWTALPGRQFVVDNLGQLGLPLPWMPLSLDPEATVATALALIPPLAIAATVLRQGPPRDGLLVAALIAGSFLSLCLGILQVSRGGPYLFTFSSVGAAAGLFANANHAATLLLVTIPFLVGWVADRWRGASNQRQRQTTLVLGAAGLVLLLVGLAVNGALAGIGLAVPAFAASALLMIPRGRVRVGRMVATLAALMVVGGATAYLAKRASFGPSENASFAVRQQIWQDSRALLGEQLAVGSGLGTYQEMYRRFEDPERVTRFYVNHAHNDPLEWIVETGLPGALLLLAFVGWWGWQANRVWRADGGGPLARSATIASAVIMVHSLVDFPLRSPGIAVIMGLSLALMAEERRRARAAQAAGDRRPARHLSLTD